MRRSVWTVVGVLAWLGCGEDVTGRSPIPDAPLVSGARIAEVSLYQGVKVPLAIEASVLEPRSLPVVLGRDALLRVFVTPEPGWQPREVIVRLEGARGGSALQPRESQQFVASASFEADLSSSFNFELPGDELTSDYEYRLSLREVDQAVAAPSPAARSPRDGSFTPLGAGSSGSSSKMVLVPIRYEGDGSGRLPDTSDEQVERYRRLLFDRYPVPRVDVRLRAPVPFAEPIAAFSDAWSTLLQLVLAVRQQDIVQGVATDDEYYYGLVAPAASFEQYCGQDCLLGLTFQVEDAPLESHLRGSVGIGFAGELAAETFVHEMGHAHGRKHAPCAPQFSSIEDVDPQYPHPNAGLGSWGYSLSLRELVDPAGPARDFMSYCEPTWVSDYTFAGLFQTIAAVNVARDFLHSSESSSAFRAITVGAGGELALGVTLNVRGLPSGRPERILVERSGSPPRGVTAYFHPHADHGGGMLLVSEAEIAGGRLRVRGRALLP